MPFFLVVVSTNFSHDVDEHALFRQRMVGSFHGFPSTGLSLQTVY